jgi:hypothetical protein
MDNSKLSDSAARGEFSREKSIATHLQIFITPGRQMLELPKKIFVNVQNFSVSNL